MHEIIEKRKSNLSLSNFWVQAPASMDEDSAERLLREYNNRERERQEARELERIVILRRAGIRRRARIRRPRFRPPKK